MHIIQDIYKITHREAQQKHFQNTWFKEISLFIPLQIFLIIKLGTL